MKNVKNDVVVRQKQQKFSFDTSKMAKALYMLRKNKKWGLKRQ
ncbi:hypothetical protein [Priestia megaterium]